MRDREGADGYLDDIRDKIAVHGWAVQGVAAAADEEWQTPFAYTIGLTALGHPELLIIGLPVKLGGSLLNDLGELVRAGHRLKPGDEVDGIVEGFPLRVVAVDDTTDWLIVANEIYREQAPVHALQMVWPDDEGRCPWQAGYNEDADVQPVLGTQDAG